MQGEIREFSERDYEALAAVRNAIYADWPSSKEDLHHGDRTRDPKCKWRRFLYEENGRILAYGGYSQSAWMYHPRKFFVQVNVLPGQRRRGIGRALFDHVMAALEPHEPLSVRISANEAHEDGLRFVEAQRFKMQMREQESELDLTRFDPSAFTADSRRANEAGIEIKGFSELAQDPSYKRKLWELDMIISPDMPSPEPITALSFEIYNKELFENPRFFPEGYMVALDGPRYVGMSNLWKTELPKRLHTGLTGVLREYRKRGVATALKLGALGKAKELGYESVFTWNDSTNERMLNINWRLGFQKRPAWIDFELALGEARESGA